MNAIYLKTGYAKRTDLDGWYRPLTVKEAKNLSWSTRLYAIDRSGCVREIRLNGKPKTWKRATGCELSLKYGLKECFRVGGKELKDHEPIDDSIVVAVDYPFDKDVPAGVVSDYVKEQLGV